MHLPLWHSQFHCMGLCAMTIKVFLILYEGPYFGGNSVLSAPRPSPALQVAEVQQVKLSAVLGVIDGVHILGATLPMSVFAAVQYMTTPPPPHLPRILSTVLHVTLKSTHSDTGTVPQLLPTALPPCS